MLREAGGKTPKTFSLVEVERRNGNAIKAKVKLKIEIQSFLIPTWVSGAGGASKDR